MLDFAAYLDRVGLVVSPSLTPAQVHRAHVTHIPFENLDPYLGAVVSLDQADLERKLVRERRGGYCFEHNLLLKSALEEIGAEVELLLARVRLGGDPERVRALTHLVLRVGHGGRTWLADAGFGAGTLLEPIPFSAGEENDQAGWRYRLVPDGAGLALALQRSGQREWQTLYSFVPEPVPFADLELANWFTCTHPSSSFVRFVRVSLRGEDGTQTMVLGDPEQPDGLVLSVQRPTGTRSEPLALADLPELLEGRFSLGGFGLGEDGRLARPGVAADPGGRRSVEFPTSA